MATGKATIRGRAGTSTSGTKVSQYSPQYRQTTGQEAADRGTNSASIALSNLNNEQKQIANTLGLSKAQVLALNQRQLSQLSYNLKYASPWKVQQLSRMYGNVSTHQLIQSGRSGMSKVDVMKYNRALDQKSFGTGVSIKKAERVISRNSPESRVTTLKRFDSQTGTYTIPTSTLQNLSGQVRTAGDYQAVLNIAKKSMFTASRSEKERIVAARNYILSVSGGNRQQNYDYFLSLEYSIASQLPITANTSQKDQNTILKARQWFLKNTPAEAKDYTKSWFSYMDKSGSKISLEKYVNKIYNSKKDKNIKQYASNLTTEEQKSKRLQEYQVRLKKEEMEKELGKYAGDSKLKKSLANIYEATYDINNLQKTLSQGNRKTEYSITRPLIEKPVSKLVKTEAYKKLEKEMSKDPTLKAISETVADEYHELTKKPINYAAETVALMGAGKAFKYGRKGLKAVSGKVIEKVAGKKAAEKSLKLAGKNIVAKEIPVLAVDAYFLGQIGKSFSEGADRSTSDTQWITKQNLELAKDLAIMGVGAREGKKVSSKSSKIKAQPKAKIKDSYRLQQKATGLKGLSQKKAATLQKKNIALMSRRKAKAAKQAQSKKKLKDMSPEEAVKLREKNIALIKSRKANALKVAEKKTTRLKGMSYEEATTLQKKNAALMVRRKAKAAKQAQNKKKLKNMSPEEAATLQKKNIALMSRRKAKAAKQAQSKKKLKDMSPEEAVKLREKNIALIKSRKANALKAAEKKTTRLKGMSYEEAAKLGKRNREKMRKPKAVIQGKLMSLILEDNAISAVPGLKLQPRAAIKAASEVKPVRPSIGRSEYLRVKTKSEKIPLSHSKVSQKPRTRLQNKHIAVKGNRIRPYSSVKIYQNQAAKTISEIRQIELELSRFQTSTAVRPRSTQRTAVSVKPAVKSSVKQGVKQTVQQAVEQVTKGKTKSRSLNRIQIEQLPIPAVLKKSKTKASGKKRKSSIVKGKTVRTNVIGSILSSPTLQKKVQKRTGKHK